jgi:hypothetical protein
MFCTFDPLSELLLAAKSALFIVLCDSLTGPEVEPVHNSFFVFSHGSGQQEEDLKRDVLVGFYHFLSMEKIGGPQPPTVRRGSRFFRFNSSCFYYQLSRLSFLQTAVTWNGKTRLHILV